MLLWDNIMTTSHTLLCLVDTWSQRHQTSIRSLSPPTTPVILHKSGQDLVAVWKALVLFHASHLAGAVPGDVFNVWSLGQGLKRQSDEGHTGPLLFVLFGLYISFFHLFILLFNTFELFAGKKFHWEASRLVGRQMSKNIITDSEVSSNRDFIHRVGVDWWIFKIYGIR